MNKLLFPPETQITAVTTIGDPPDLNVGDRIAVTLQVVDVQRCPVSPGKAFWHYTLVPSGEALTFAAGPPIHIEAAVERVR